MLLSSASGVQEACEDCRSLLNDAGLEDTIGALVVPSCTVTPRTASSVRDSMLPPAVSCLAQSAGKETSKVEEVASCSRAADGKMLQRVKPEMGSSASLCYGPMQPPDKKISVTKVTKRKRDAVAEAVPHTSQSSLSSCNTSVGTETHVSKANKKLKLSLKNSPTRASNQSQVCTDVPQERAP